MTFFNDHCARKLLFTGETVCCHSMDCLFDLHFKCKPIFTPPAKIFSFLFFFTKTCFFVYITHSSLNFTWFSLFSHQKFDQRPLFKPGALFDMPPFRIASKQIFLRDYYNFYYKSIPRGLHIIVTSDSKKGSTKFVFGGFKFMASAGESPERSH